MTGNMHEDAMHKTKSLLRLLEAALVEREAAHQAFIARCVTVDKYRDQLTNHIGDSLAMAAEWEHRDWDAHRRWVDEITRLRAVTAQECFPTEPKETA